MNAIAGGVAGALLAVVVLLILVMITVVIILKHYNNRREVNKGTCNNIIIIPYCSTCIQVPTFSFREKKIPGLEWGSNSSPHTLRFSFPRRKILGLV